MAYKRVSPMPVSEGGTGAQTLAVNTVLIGDGTSAISQVTAGTTGQVLTGVTSGAPTFQSPAASSITITGNSGGGLTGNSFTFTGGTTGLTFSGSGTTETVTGTLVVGNGGTGAATLTGVLIGNGTSAVSGNAITQYDTLVGGSSNAISSVAPSATAGVPLVSGGSSANPSYTTAVVAGGGTGNTTFTAYSVLAAGTTATGAFQNVSGVGTSGQILTSQGASNLPHWASPAASSITITGDSGGGLTGNSFTLTGGTTGLTFSGSGTTETVTGTLVVGNGGTGAATLTGVLIGNGTSAVSGNAITQHYTLVGGASNAITSVAPSATAGIPLVSGGSAANPSYTTAVVGGGGTGNTTFTAYSLITAGTTATGAFQNVSGVGTSGQVLTSQGASALPQWANASGGITTIDGNSSSVTGSTVSIVDSQGSAVFSGSSSTLTHTYTDANSNTVIGSFTHYASMTGEENTILGSSAGGVLVAGSLNTLIGVSTGVSITSGSNNCIVGVGTGSFTTGTQNTIIGYSNGGNYTGAESNNIILGNNVTGTVSESNVFRVGNATGTSSGDINASYVCGITGIVVTGSAVLISSGNQLGVAASSAQFKNDIQDMADATQALLKLRPVTFTWNKASSPGLADATDARQFGLIAEEVAQIMPSLVNLDKDGKPFSVNYQDLPAMLLNELQKALKRIEVLEQKLGV